MIDKKATKMDVLTAVRNTFEGMQNFKMTLDNGIDVAAVDVLKYCENTMRQIKSKADKAAEKNREKAAEGDKLIPIVRKAITKNYQTLDEIMSAINDPEVTRHKAIARLSILVDSGAVIKDTKKLDKRGKITVYRLA